MKYSNEDDIEAAVGADQLSSVEDDIDDALNGSFDGIMDINDDDLETMMDAATDLSDMEDFPDGDAEIARGIVDECQGVDGDGMPKVSISLTLDMVNPDTGIKRSLAQQAMYKPVIKINKRMEFIEIVMTFPTAIDSNLKILSFNLDKYGEQLNALTELSTAVPLMSFVFVPISGLGCYYMVANNPVMWALQPEAINAPVNQMKLLFRCEDIGFFQTDEVDMSEIEAGIQREYDAEAQALSAMEAKERAAEDNQQQLDLIKASLDNQDE